MINYEEFSKVELRIAKVLKAERVEGSEKLLRMEVDAGDKDEAGQLQLRQIVSGIAKAYNPEDMVGKLIVIVANLEPRKLMSLESQGMLLAASEPDGLPILLVPDKDIAPGSGIK